MILILDLVPSLLLETFRTTDVLNVQNEIFKYRANPMDKSQIQSSVNSLYYRKVTLTVIVLENMSKVALKFPVSDI